VVNVPILSDEQLTAVVGLLGARGFALAGIGTHLPSLDEVFLAITGQKSTPQEAPATPAAASTHDDEKLEVAV
jgi:oleandomycin transport system ATP-binding protein